MSARDGLWLEAWSGEDWTAHDGTACEDSHDGEWVEPSRTDPVYLFTMADGRQVAAMICASRIMSGYTLHLPGHRSASAVLVNPLALAESGSEVFEAARP